MPLSNSYTFNFIDERFGEFKTIFVKKEMGQSYVYPATKCMGAPLHNGHIYERTISSLYCKEKMARPGNSLLWTLL